MVERWQLSRSGSLSLDLGPEAGHGGGSHL